MAGTDGRLGTEDLGGALAVGALQPHVHTRGRERRFLVIDDLEERPGDGDGRARRRIAMQRRIELGFRAGLRHDREREGEHGDEAEQGAERGGSTRHLVTSEWWLSASVHLWSHLGSR